MNQYKNYLALPFILFMGIILSSSRVFAQSAKTINIPLGAFVPSNGGYSWPSASNPEIIVRGGPNQPSFGSTITEVLDSSINGTAFYSEAFLDSGTLIISAQVAADNDPDADDYSYVNCSVNGGDPATYEGGASATFTLTAAKGKHTGSLACYLSYGYLATITITSMVFHPNSASISPVNSNDSPICPTNSTINMDSLSLGENIPLVGIPFSLNYSSDRFRNGLNFAPRSLGLGGWTPSIVHHYDSTDSLLYMGDNGIRNIVAVQTAAGYYATDLAGTEIYYFDTNGIHQQTKDALTGVVKYNFNYDSRGRLISIADYFGNVTTAQYSSSGVVLTSPYGQSSMLTFDSNGFLASVTNPNNETYSLTSDSTGNLLTYTKPMGQTSTHTYDDDGYLLKDQGAGGNFISLIRQFDPDAMVQTVIASSALNRTTVYQTSATSSSSSHTVTAPDGSVGQRTSKDQVSDGSTDAYGNISQSTPAQDPRFGWLAPYNASASFTVPNSNVAPNVQVNKTATLSNGSDPLSLTSLTSTVTLQNDSSRVFTSSYSASNHLITMKSPLNRVMYETLNANGLPSQIQAGGLTPVSFGYDSRGRLSSVAQSNRQMTLAYDAHGNVASSKDVLGQITSFKYDNANRVIQEKLPNGTVISMTYDSNGNLTSLTPPGRPAHQFSYNLFELVQSYLPPALSAQLSGATNYSYNLDRQLTQVSRPDGTQVDFNYDTTTGLLDSITTPSGNYTLTYNAKSDLVKNLTSPDGETLSYQYAGNLLTSVSSAGPVSSANNYTYNPDGTLASIIFAGSVPENIFYDKDGLTTKVGDLALTRNNVGSISASTLGKVSEAASLDKFGQISSDKFVSEKKILFSENFSRDKLGRITEIDQTKGFDAGRIGYNYDSAGRLTQVLRNGFPIRSYKYDANGNRIEVTGEDNHIKAEYNAQDQLTKYGNAEYSYNANGDLIQKIENRKSWFDFWSKHENKQKKTAYNYDVFGNLKSVTLPDGKLIEYIVDGQNRRVGKKINGKLAQGFIYQSQTQVAAELDANGRIVKQFIYGSKINIPDYMIMNGKEYRIISDQVGTPKMIVDSAKGQVVARMKFDEFGIPSGHFDNDGCDRNKHGDHDDHGLSLPFGFAGGLYDRDTGLVRFGARDYDPEVGRWTSKDPILFSGGDTNLYGYTFSDPINFIDQNGLWGIQIGSGGGLDFLFGGGSADSGIAITYSKKSGLQIGFYGTKTVKTGYGVSGGLGVGASVTPGAQCLQDLEGSSTGGGIDSAISGSLFRSTTPDGRQLNTYGISVGKGTGLFPYGGISSTRIVH